MNLTSTQHERNHPMHINNSQSKSGIYQIHATSVITIATLICAGEISGCFLDYDMRDKAADSSSTSGEEPQTDDDAETTSVTTETDVVGEDSDTDVVPSDDDTPITDSDPIADTFTGPDTQEHKVTFCEEASEKALVALECGKSGVIDSIDLAIFGQYEGSCAGNDATVGKCYFEETAAVIEEKCLGQSVCILIADKKEVFDDPCKKEKHNLIVAYTCRYEVGCPGSAIKTAPGKCGCNIPDRDSDGDGSADCNDQCDDDPDKINSGICGCDASEKDEEDKDNDGVPKCHDRCDKDPDKIEEGLCGCGTEDIDIGDRDGDGTINCRDRCPDDSQKTSPGICGCHKIDDPTDSDGDGTADCVDGCPSDPHKNQSGYCGCGSPENCDGVCLDTPGYRDPRGENCNYWDNDCLLFWLWGYTDAQGKEIKKYCPESCGLCN